MLEDLFHYPTSVSLLGVIMGLLVLHFFYSSFSFQEKGTEPPGPKPLPLLGNLLQVDLKKLDSSLFDVRNVFFVLNSKIVSNALIGDCFCKSVADLQKVGHALIYSHFDYCNTLY